MSNNYGPHKYIIKSNIKFLTSRK